MEAFLRWCRHTDSNRGPTDYKSVALPTELCRQRLNALTYIITKPPCQQKFIVIMQSMIVRLRLHPFLS